MLLPPVPPSRVCKVQSTIGPAADQLRDVPGAAQGTFGPLTNWKSIHPLSPTQSEHRTPHASGSSSHNKAKSFTAVRFLQTCSQEELPSLSSILGT